jgi:succinate dehydrogenase / fumarate reductase, cytochrome b subunit
MMVACSAERQNTRPWRRLWWGTHDFSGLQMPATTEVNEPPARAPTRIAAFYRTTVGKKLVMAVSGLILFGFIVGHLAGNLQVFLGADKLNDYAAFLRRTPELLWPARLALLAALVLHVVASAQIVLANRRARPARYAVKRAIETNYAARTMAISGPLVLLYLIYHLAMFTFLITGPGYSPTDVYRNVVLSFQSPSVAVIYIVAMLLLGLHLYHGVWSMLHTLGISSPHYRWLRRGLAPVVAVAITAGYIAIPLAILTGMVQ